MPLPNSLPTNRMVAGRLALDFANLKPVSRMLSWDEFVAFLVDARVVVAERAAHLLALPGVEPMAVDGVLLKAIRLRESLRAIFAAMVEQQGYSKSWVGPINDILQLTEGHDELQAVSDRWQLQFVAREDRLEWLLAAVARSAAELLVEGTSAPIRRCANPKCRLFFYDDSRTRQRRWCAMAVCGNRHKVAAFHRRHAGLRDAS